MKNITNPNQTKVIIILIIIFSLMNITLWGQKLLGGFPDSLYSSGIAFSSDGTALKFSDRFAFQDKHFNFSVKYNWNNKTNTMQETGIATHDLFGGLNIAIDDSSSFGSSLLGDIELDEELLFGRSYMQSGRANISVIPLSGSGEFDKLCYYLLFLERVYCGASSVQNTFTQP
jgi:hypothetical protein